MSHTALLLEHKNHFSDQHPSVLVKTVKNQRGCFVPATGIRLFGNMVTEAPCFASLFFWALKQAYQDNMSRGEYRAIDVLTGCTINRSCPRESSKNPPSEYAIRDHHALLRVLGVVNCLW